MYTEKTIWTILSFVFGAATLACQPIIFDGTEWGIHYLNAHPSTIRLLPLGIAVGFSFIFTCTVTTIKDAVKPILVVNTVTQRKAMNPFWGWFGASLVIVTIINLLLE